MKIQHSLFGIFLLMAGNAMAAGSVDAPDTLSYLGLKSGATITSDLLSTSERPSQGIIEFKWVQDGKFVPLELADHSRAYCRVDLLSATPGVLKLTGSVVSGHQKLYEYQKSPDAVTEGWLAYFSCGKGYFNQPGDQDITVADIKAALGAGAKVTITEEQAKELGL
jgi:hypothetical protein